jgi:uncharacterized membrane protein
MKSLKKPDHLTLPPSEWSYLHRLSLKLKPEIVFLCFALALGFSLLVIVPPFQSPDAQHHFFRAYQISEGIMVGEHFRVEYLPKSLKFVWEVTSRDIPLHPDQKITPADILSAFQIPLNPHDRSFIASFAAPYAPQVYFPQALGLFVGRQLGLGPLALHYLGRLFTLFFCIWLFYWSIKRTPVLKWVFCLLAATPSNIFFAASCSPDAVINGLAFLFTASVLDLALSPEKEFTARSILLPAIVGALLAPVKGGAYAPMLAFFLFVPVRKTASLPRYLALVTFAAIPALVTFTAWTIASQHQLLPIFDSASTDLGGPNRTTLLWGIWEDPLRYLWILANTTTESCKGYVAQSIGLLGQTDTLLPRSIIIAYLALVSTSAVLGDPSEKRITIRSKIIAGLVVIIVYVCIQTVHYLSFTPNNSAVVHGFLGRYLIPLGPAFFLVFQNRGQILGPRFNSLFPLIVVTFMLAVIPTTLLTVTSRYYGEEQPTWRMSFGLGPVVHPVVHVKISSSDDFFQTFVCPLDGLTGVSLVDVDSSLPPGNMITGYRFVLKDAVCGGVVREVGIQPFRLKNSEYVDILFDPILDSKNKKYTFTVYPTDEAASIPISLPMSEPRVYPEGETIVHGRKIDRTVVFALIFRSSARPGN